MSRTEEVDIDIAISVEVAQRREIVPGRVTELTMVQPDGHALPTWEPGAHIDVVLPSGLVRQYSLCGNPGDDAYRIAVLKEEVSRGGSVEIHETIHVGDRLMLRGPRNHFPLVQASRTVFIAGGIGITPMLPMIRDRVSAGADWALHYGGRSRSHLAYLDELAEWDAVTVYPQDEIGLIPLDDILATASGGVVYACGPEPLLTALQEKAPEFGVDLHFERFGPPAAPRLEESVNTEFQVTLQRSARTLTVAADQRLIDVVREVVPTVPFSCEEGYCGSCETGVLGGIPDHRDSVLSEAERAANDTMMICVGRCQGPELILDL